MSENRSLLEKKVATYKKNHQGNSFGDIERSKVKKDKLTLQKSKKALNSVLDSMITDITDDTADEYEALLHQEKRARGSVKTHGHRIKELSQHDDFK